MNSDAVQKIHRALHPLYTPRSQTPMSVKAEAYSLHRRPRNEGVNNFCSIVDSFLKFGSVPETPTLESLL